ncbi:MAG: PAS domain-containing protein, partial [Balneolales bacterium]|nr:PAS domain-containing protein [Balneolales bacterium]
MQADVTAQKEAAGKLEAQRWLYEQILEQTMAGYWDWYVKDNTEYLSPGFKKMFGYKDYEMENTPEAWQEIIFEEDLEKVFRVYEDHVSSRGESPYYAEVRFCRYRIMSRRAARNRPTMQRFATTIKTAQR